MYFSSYRPSLIIELPVLATHGAQLGMGLRVEPLHDTVHMEAMRADTPDNGTIISGKGALWTAVFKVHPADTTVVVVGQPAPGSHSCPIWRDDKDDDLRIGITEKWCGFLVIFFVTLVHKAHEYNL